MEQLDELSNADGVPDEKDVLEAVRMIIDRRHNQIDIDGIANCLNISRRTLERRFRKMFGLPIRRVVTLIRLELARQLLCETDLSIFDVSAEVGFSSHSRMVNVFQRYLRCSPQEVRRLNSLTRNEEPPE